jgi:hypothetical protein
MFLRKHVCFLKNIIFLKQLSIKIGDGAALPAPLRTRRELASGGCRPRGEDGWLPNRAPDRRGILFGCSAPREDLQHQSRRSTVLARRHQ